MLAEWPRERKPIEPPRRTRGTPSHDTRGQEPGRRKTMSNDK
jgi:hypothetical protein